MSFTATDEQIRRVIPPYLPNLAHACVTVFADYSEKPAIFGTAPLLRHLISTGFDSHIFLFSSMPSLTTIEIANFTGSASGWVDRWEYTLKFLSDTCPTLEVLVIAGCNGGHELPQAYETTFVGQVYNFPRLHTITTTRFAYHETVIHLLRRISAPNLGRVRLTHLGEGFGAGEERIPITLPPCRIEFDSSLASIRLFLSVVVDPDADIQLEAVRAFCNANDEEINSVLNRTAEYQDPDWEILLQKVSRINWVLPGGHILSGHAENSLSLALEASGREILQKR